MLGGSQLAPPPSSSSTTVPETEEDEFLKRNTDCVYFLASPLTCKKGSECEYRHSDIARVNPRDCWYWLNGNCLNPKCAFRHPPLDGLLEAEDLTSMGLVSQAPVKQGVACIFFQKGFCLKGHLCPFSHGQPKRANNLAVHPIPSIPVNKPSKVVYGASDKSIKEQKFTQQENVQKPTEIPHQGKQGPRAQQRNGGAGGGIVMEKKVASTCEEPPRYKPASVAPPPVMNELPPSRSNHGVHETNHFSDNEGTNGKEVDEYSREPSPGFDVLVDNELGDSEYYPNEEQFGRSRGHDFDTGRSVDLDVDHDIYHDQRDFDHYNTEGYAWEDHRENSNFGRKRYPRDESPDQFDQTDLRHRLSKQRRGNYVGGLRSVISREHSCDSHTERMPRRDVRYGRHMDSGPLSSRLRGRIKIPRSTSPGYENGSRVEREIDRGRQQRSRYSPGWAPHVSSDHSRLRDRVKGRSNDDFNNEGRDYRSFRGNDSESTLGKRKYPRTESQHSEDKSSFEGPKPLSEILKRKRGSVISSVNNEDNNFKENDENNQKEIKETPFGNMVNADNEKSTDGQASLNHEVSDVVNKAAGSIDEDAMLDQELEAYDHKDGDYDYEQIDGEEYNLEEGDEYLEEEDDTGKKESGVYNS